MAEKKDIQDFGYDNLGNRNVYPTDNTNIVYDAFSNTNPVSIISGLLVGNLTLSDGNFQSGNFVSGSAGYQFTSTGSIEANQGTFRGSLTGNTISGATITGSTLQTGTSGANVNITASRFQVRSDTTEVGYFDLGSFGGGAGLKDLSGNSILRWEVRNSGADANLICDVGDLFIQVNDDIIFSGGIGNDIYPATSGTMSFGLNSNKWADVQSVLINGVSPLMETRTYFVATTSGGSPTQTLTFSNGILISES